MTDSPSQPAPRVSKRRPPSGTRCDAHVGIDCVGRDPVVKRCPNEATVEILGAAPVGETWVCATCAEALMKRRWNQ